jgi:hypothetical protein
MCMRAKFYCKGRKGIYVILKNMGPLVLIGEEWEIALKSRINIILGVKFILP